MAGKPLKKKKAVPKVRHPETKKKASAPRATKAPPEKTPEKTPKKTPKKAPKKTPETPKKTPKTPKKAQETTPKKKLAAAKRSVPAKRGAVRVAATPSTERSPVTKPEAPPATPSERLLAARAQEPTERSLTDEEREAMMKVADTARRFVGASGEPSSIIASIATFLEDVRRGLREEPRSQDVRLGLGVLWGEQLRAQVGWRWVHLTYPDGFASYALVPDDRAFACFPLNRIPEALRPNATNTSAHVFESIRENTLPSRRPNAYLVIG